MGRFLSRNKGKTGEDGRTTIDKMARGCAAVERVMRWLVGKGAQMCASSCVDLWVKESGGWKNGW